MTTTLNSKPNPFIALKSGDFRLYVAGQLISVSGTWMQNLAQGFLVFQMTQSEAWLGAVAAAAGVPFVVVAPLAGVIVERVPRRRLLLATQTTQMALALILAGLTFSGMVQVWHILLLALLLGTTNALDMPARQTFVVEIVGPEYLSSGIAINSVLNSASRVLGPAAAGIALVQLGPGWCFLLNAISFLAVIVMLVLMSVPYAIETARAVKPLHQLREGLAFARRDSRIAPLLLLTAIGGLSVVPVIQLLPAFADVVLHSPRDGYAALSVAQGVGSVVAGVGAAWLAHRFGYGRLLITASFLSPIASLLLALQVSVPGAAVVSLLSGALLILQFVSLNTSIQSAVPNSYRGRVLALYTLAFMGIAPFSALVLGVIASLFGTPVAMSIYAVLGAFATCVVLIRWPRLAKL